MFVITVEADTFIARPPEVVRAQFADMHHHLAANVHPSLGVSDVREVGPVCRFTSRRRVLGVVHTDEIELERQADGSVVARSVAGTNVGLRIVQGFQPEGPDGTRVRVRVELPVAGWKRLLAPLIRAGVRQDTARSLEEDRRDLEERGYGRATG